LARLKFYSNNYKYVFEVINIILPPLGSVLSYHFSRANRDNITLLEFLKESLGEEYVKLLCTVVEHELEKYGVDINFYTYLKDRKKCKELKDIIVKLKESQI